MASNWPVREPDVDQRRERVVVEKSLPLTEALVHFLRGRWNVRRRGERAARRTDPVLRAAELAGRGPIPAHPAHELLVEFADEPQGKWQLRQALDAVFQRVDVVGHLAKVLRAAVHLRAGFRRQQLAQRGLRALDAAGKHRLAANEGADQEVGVGQATALAGQFPDEAVRVRQCANQPRAPIELWGRGAGNEGLVASGTANHASGRSGLRRGHRGSGKGRKQVGLLLSI